MLALQGMHAQLPRRGVGDKHSHNAQSICGIPAVIMNRVEVPHTCAYHFYSHTQTDTIHIHILVTRQQPYYYSLLYSLHLRVIHDIQCKQHLQYVIHT